MKYKNHYVHVTAQFAVLCAVVLTLPTANLLAQATAVQENVDYKTVISDFIEATGGEKAYAGIESMKVTGTMSIPQANLEGKLLSVQDKKHSYTKIELPGIGTELVGHNGETVWKVSEMTGPEIIEDSRAKQMLRHSKISPLMSVADDYESVECTGTEEFNGEECYVLVMKNEDEDPEYYYFSVESKLQVGTKLTTADPMQGKMEIVSKLTDYKEVGGVKFPHTTTAELPIGMSLVTTIETIEVNGKIDKSLFELPAEIKDLKDDN